MLIRRWFVGRIIRPSSGLEIFWREQVWTLGDALTQRVPGAATAGATAPARGDFTFSDFGAVERLAWNGGACATPRDTPVGFWGARYAAWASAGALAVADSQTSRVLELRAPALFGRVDKLHASDDQLVVCGEHDVIAVPLAALEALFETGDGPLDVDVKTMFPLRRPERRDKGTVRFAWHTFVQVDLVNGGAVYPPPNGFVREGDFVELADELWHQHFLTWTLEDGTVRTIAPPETPASVTAQLSVGHAVDPTGDAFAVVAAPERQAVVDDLLRTFADEPDAGTASVLVDLLEESGAPYAALLARLLAGDTSVRAEALGPLAYYLADIEYTHALPTAAVLASAAPPAAEFLDAVCADQRLGLLRTLRLGDGAPKLYARLVGSPRAVGLRHVDLPNPTVLAALVAGRRVGLTQLSNVKFTAREVIDGLADPMFDRVAVVHFETTPQRVAAQLAFVARDESKFWARVPRRLVLTDKDGREAALHDAIRAAWEKLPVAGVTAGSLVLRRA